MRTSPDARRDVLRRLSKHRQPPVDIAEAIMFPYSTSPVMLQLAETKTEVGMLARFGVDSGSPRRWWMIGAATVAATAGILVMSVHGPAYAIGTHDPDTVTPSAPSDTHVIPGPCFVHPVNWDEVFGGPFPVCYHRVPGK
jgi:hypothetical protein